MKYKKINAEVLFSDESAPRLDKTDLEFLKQEALQNPRKRIRLCTHRGTDACIHEMFIVHTRDAYVRPHKHPGKSESLFVIQGEAEAVFFDAGGGVIEKIKLGLPVSEKAFYYRIDNSVFHTLIINSDVFCFKEVTSGPFRKGDTLFAPWSPEETDTAGVQKFLENLKQEVG